MRDAADLYRILNIFEVKCEGITYILLSQTVLYSSHIISFISHHCRIIFYS